MNQIDLSLKIFWCWYVLHYLFIWFLYNYDCQKFITVKTGLSKISYIYVVSDPDTLKWKDGKLDLWRQKLII